MDEFKVLIDDKYYKFNLKTFRQYFSGIVDKKNIVFSNNKIVFPIKLENIFGNKNFVYLTINDIIDYNIETNGEIDNIHIKFGVTNKSIYVYAISREIADLMDYELRIKINSIDIEIKTNLIENMVHEFNSL